MNVKRSQEAKKIERLESSLHMLHNEEALEEGPISTHTVFVDDEKEGKKCLLGFTVVIRADDSCDLER